MNMITLTQDNFDAMVAKHELIVVDFWAQWCAPCQSFDKVVSVIAKQYPDVAFAKVDIDQEKALAEEFHILSVPAVMILRHRTIVFADAGALTGTALSELIDQAKALDPQKLKMAADEVSDPE